MGPNGIRKALGAAAALAVAAAVVAGCAPSTPSSTTPATTPKEPIKIGAVISETGSYAGLGAGQLVTLKMEADRLNKAGGINGRQVQLVIEDDGTDAAKAQTAVTKLIDQDKVIVVLGATGTGETMSMRGDVDRAGIPQVSMAGGNVVTGQFDPLVFTTAWSNKIVVPFEFAYMQKKGIKKIALISDTGGFGKDGLEILTADAPKFGMTIVANETFNLGDTDMTPQLTKIKAAAPDAIVLWTAGKEASTVVKNASTLGIKAQLFGSHGNARKEFIAGAGAAAEGFRFAAGKILIPDTYGAGTPQFKTATDYIANFKAAAAGKTPDTFAGHAYDAFNITVEAAKRVTGDLTPKALRDEIEKTSGYPGIGGTFTFSPTNHNGMTEKDLVMYEVKNGTWQLAK